MMDENLVSNYKQSIWKLTELEMYELALTYQTRIRPKIGQYFLWWDFSPQSSTMALNTSIKVM